MLWKRTKSYPDKSISGKLPAVFPLLLYNGDARWTAESSIQNIIEDSIPLKYIPRFEYYVVSENSFSKQALRRIKNALSAVFYVENSSPEELEKEMDILIDIIRDEKPAILGEFAAWFGNFLETSARCDENDGLLSKKGLLSKVEGVLEVKTMFATKLKEYGEKVKKEAEKKKALEDAKNLKTLGVSIDIICKATCLDKKKVEDL